MAIRSTSPRQVPVTPDSDDARNWLSDELAESSYQEAKPGFLEQLWNAVLDWLFGLFENFQSLDAGIGTTLLAVGSAIVIIVAVLLVRPRLNARRGSSQPAVFDDGVLRSAARHRELADNAAGAGDWDTALTERFRAIVRSAEERGVIDEQPGRTAGEVAMQLEGAFGTSRDSIVWIADRFNEVHYGSQPADNADYVRAVSLDSMLLEARPALSAATTRWAVPS